MGLTISALVEETSAYVIAKERLWLTADRERLVIEGDRAAAFLFAIPGHRISKADAERYGLLEGAEAPYGYATGGLVAALPEPDAPAEPLGAAEDQEPDSAPDAPDPAPAAEPVKRPRGRSRKVT